MLRHSIPWPCESEIPCLSWLLAACCFHSALGAEFLLFFPSTGVRELSLCETGERGVDCCDIRNGMPWYRVRKQFVLRGSESKASESMHSSHYSPGFSGPSLPPVIDLSLGIWFFQVDGRTQGFPSGAASHDAVSNPSLIKPEPASHWASALSSGRGAHSLLPNSSQTSSVSWSHCELEPILDSVSSVYVHMFVWVCVHHWARLLGKSHHVFEFCFHMPNPSSVGGSSLSHDKLWPWCAQTCTWEDVLMWELHWPFSFLLILYQNQPPSSLVYMRAQFRFESSRPEMLLVPLSPHPI